MARATGRDRQARLSSSDPTSSCRWKVGVPSLPRVAAGPGTGCQDDMPGDRRPGGSKGMLRGDMRHPPRPEHAKLNLHATWT